MPVTINEHKIPYQFNKTLNKTLNNFKKKQECSKIMWYYTHTKMTSPIYIYRFIELKQRKHIALRPAKFFADIGFTNFVL